MNVFEIVAEIDYNDPVFKAVQAIMRPDKVKKSGAKDSPSSYDEAFAAIMNENRPIKSKDQYHKGWN